MVHGRDYHCPYTWPGDETDWLIMVLTSFTLICFLVLILDYNGFGSRTVWSI